MKTLAVAGKKISDALGKVAFADALVFGGIGLLGYGLYLWQPWAAYAVVGAVLFIIGILGSR